MPFHSGLLPRFPGVAQGSCGVAAVWLQPLRRAHLTAFKEGQESALLGVQWILGSATVIQEALLGVKYFIEFSLVNSWQ